MGRERARCVRALGARIHMVFDIDFERACQLGEEFGATVAKSPEECFSNRLAAVFVCVAPGARGRLEIESIDAGIPVFVEKPIGVSVESSLPLLKRLRERPVVNAVGYMNRYRSSVRMARDRLQKASVIGLSAHWVCKRYGVSWWDVDQLSGGPHNEQATHLFDLSRFLLGEIVEIDSRAESPRRVSSTFRFESGALGTALYSCEAQSKDIGVRIFTQEGTIALIGWDFQLAENTIDSELFETDEDVFLVETQAFLEAVRQEKQELVRSDFEDALRTQQVMDACRKSSMTRQHPSAVRV